MKSSIREWSVVGGLIGAVVLVVGLIWGPAGLKTSLLGWVASAYGSDWLVVQYAQSGCVISSWELKDAAIHNEYGSDGIYFVTEAGPVVHLSGHYTYVQGPDATVRAELLAVGPCASPVPRP